mgnify:CR=1 FL=1
MEKEKKEEVPIYNRFLETKKLIYDSAKHMTTLNSGLIVILSTFLANYLHQISKINFFIVTCGFLCFAGSIFFSILTITLLVHDPYPEINPNLNFDISFFGMLFAFVMFGAGVFIVIFSFLMVYVFPIN